MSTSCSDGGMNANWGIFGQIVTLQQAGHRAALATPARITGSVPCTGQSRLLVRQDGYITGTIGGGLMEAEVIGRAAKVIEADEPCLLEFELTQDEAAGAGMICGGACTVLIEPIRAGRNVEVFSAAATAEADGSGIVLVTEMPGGNLCHKLAILPDGQIVGSTGDAGTDAMLRHEAGRRGRAEEPILLTEPFRICIQQVCRPPALFIFGAGHVAVPVAQLAAMAGFRTTVVDDRADFADPLRFPRADAVCAWTVDKAFGCLPVDSGAYVVAITRGHLLDEEVVAQALRTPARYIGMIGSKRKVAAVLDRLSERGCTDADIARIHAPIGLEIGAETVEEIAVSIVAEIIAVRRGKALGAG